MEFNTSISNAETYSAEIANFRGVDFSSPVLKIESTRSPYAVNFINKFGANKKRNGYNQILQFDDNSGSALEINGIFNLNLHNQNIIVVYASNRFYRVYYDNNTQEYKAYDNIMSSCTYVGAEVLESKLKSNRVMCFISQDKAYFVGCGDYLVFGSWDNGETFELRRVIDNENTYVATTTKNINKIDSTNGDIRTTGEDANLLSTRRKNGLVGETASASFQLDASIDENTEVKVEVTLLNSDGAPTIENYTNRIYNNVLQVYEIKNELYKDGTKVGDIDFVNGRLTFNCATKNSITPEALENVIVEFSHDLGESDNITNCRFGTYFGADNSMNRLFLSGNSDFKNVDFYSASDDFTYFPRLSSTTTIGTTATAIMGYAKLSDGTLAIIKEDSQDEPSVHYRSGSTTQSTDSSGNVSFQTAFSVRAGIRGVGAVSSYAIATLASDNLFLSKNGVFGLELSSNVATTERFAKERSRYIIEKLKKHTHLENAVAYVYDNWYILSIDSVCYVADARFKTRADGSMSDTFDYEWWYWDNVDARVFCEIDNKLCFGTSDGRVCIFDDLFTDRIYHKTSVGDLSLNVVNSQITYNGSLDLKENDIFKLATNDIYMQLVSPYDFVDVVNNCAQISLEVLKNLYDGQKVHIDSSEELTAGEYEIYDIDNANLTFKLRKNDVQVQFNDVFRVSIKVTGESFKIVGVNDNKFTLKYKDIPAKFITFNETTPTEFVGYVIKATPVNAVWYTTYMNMGYSDKMKILKRLILTVEPKINARLKFGYSTKFRDEMYQSQGAGDFSFNDIDFNDFTFEGSFATSFARAVKDYFNFIVFKFESDNDSDCIIKSLKIHYSVKGNTRGVR